MDNARVHGFLEKSVCKSYFPPRKPLTNLPQSRIIAKCSVTGVFSFGNVRTEAFAPLAKLDIASVYGTEGQEFESLTAHQKAAGLVSCRFLICCASRTPERHRSISVKQTVLFRSDFRKPCRNSRALHSFIVCCGN